MSFGGLGLNQRDAQNLLELGITYPAGYAHDRDPVSKFGIISMPTTLFLTPDGEPFRKREGFVDQERFETMLDDLLRASDG